MKKKISLLFLCIISVSFSYSQVGIGTKSPTKTLDVAGELRVRQLNNVNTNTEFLNVDSDGNISKTSLKRIHYPAASQPSPSVLYTTGLKSGRDSVLVSTFNIYEVTVTGFHATNYSVVYDKFVIGLANNFDRIGYDHIASVSTFGTGVVNTISNGKGLNGVVISPSHGVYRLEVSTIGASNYLKFISLSGALRYTYVIKPVL